jgi:hypothetical protein
MKTYPILKEDGPLHAFEITSVWIRFAPLFKILNSVQGVSEIKRHRFNDDRVTFKFHDFDCVVNEPWGDSSRYWVGFANPELHSEIDISPIHEAFKGYKGLTIV